MSSHDHDHDHRHGHEYGHHHPTLPDAAELLGYYQRMELAVRELLIEKGIVTADAIRSAIEAMDARTPEQGARVVARAWLDAAFKRRLLDNGTAACQELGIEMGPTRLVVVENTPEVHNLVVCTLCSCYPWPVLGLPPAWYKDPPYRARMVREPRRLLAEMGCELPDETEIQVWDSSAEVRYLVLPQRPPDTDDMTEPELAALVTRDSMIGVATL